MSFDFNDGTSDESFVDGAPSRFFEALNLMPDLKDPAKVKEFREMLEEQVDTQNIFGMVSDALLVLLYFNLVRDKIEVIPSPAGNTYIASKFRPSLSFHRLRLTLPGAHKVLQDRIDYADSGRHHRQHDVRGHWCVYDPGEDSCAHVMTDLDETHRRCGACGRFEGWKRPHKRADSLSIHAWASASVWKAGPSRDCTAS
jgi:hypothetical protein